MIIIIINMESRFGGARCRQLPIVSYFLQRVVVEDSLHTRLLIYNALLCEWAWWAW